MKRPSPWLLAAILAAAPAAAQIERSHGSHGSSSSGSSSGSRSGGSPAVQRGGSYGGQRGGSSGGERGGGRWGGRGGGPSERSYTPNVIIKQRRVQVPAQRPEPFHRPDAQVRDSRRATPPSSDEHGRAIVKERATHPPTEHTTVVRNRVVVRDIEHQQRVEVERNHYYWHEEHGVRWAHYYDGYHWYGFYHGPRFYWTRYWYNRWWWYDPVFARWVFWYDGFWWWPGPHGAFYVFVDNSYYPYESGEVYVKQPEVEAPPVSPPSAPSQGNTYNSPDGRREVQVFGERSEAFLYDKTAASPAFLTYLGANVKDVRFSGGTNGKPLRILLDFNDGSFALYDQDGKPLDEQGPQAETTSELPAAPPPNVPPPPGGETAPSGAGHAPPGPPSE